MHPPAPWVLLPIFDHIKPIFPVFCLVFFTMTLSVYEEFFFCVLALKILKNNEKWCLFYRAMSCVLATTILCNSMKRLYLFFVNA